MDNSAEKRLTLWDVISGELKGDTIVSMDIKDDLTKMMPVELTKCKYQKSRPIVGALRFENESVLVHFTN